jgi:alpha-tubulin suppressor-like RCC1 family protein
MTTKIIGDQITDYTINTQQFSNTAIAEFASIVGAPKVLYANVTSNTYTVLDDTAVDLNGGFIRIVGSEFSPRASVLVANVVASAVTFVNSTTLHVQVPARSSGSYPLYVVNPDGGTGIKVNGVTYSAFPNWVTTSPLAGQVSTLFFGINLSATGANTYSLAAGSSLPAGTTLAANGYFSGTVSVSANTIYSFNVVATDAELQDSIRTFQITIERSYRLFSWGRNNLGQLGLNDVADRSSPTQVGANTNWALVSGSDNGWSIATKTDGTLWVMGRDLFGSLGLNVYGRRSSPTQVGTNTNWNQISSSSAFNITTKTDGTLWTWGRAINGQLGINNVFDRSSPTQVGSNTNWNRVSTGENHTVATKTDGTLWTWGQNNLSQLGQNGPGDTGRSSPIQIGSNTNWNRISSSWNSMLATKTDGTLWAWGSSAWGQLGLNDAGVYRSSPTQVGTNTNWNLISIGNSSYVLATKTDGTLWAWGRNTNGQLGLGDANSRSSPTQVGSATNWNQVGMVPHLVTSFAMATKTDGTLWTWGFNSNGQLGLNDTVSRSSPVQVGTDTGWSLMNGGIGNSWRSAAR